MSKAVLDINDQAMGLYNHNGLIVSSPGYVVAYGGQPVFGQQAFEQSRLHPGSSNNEFWHHLGLAPLSHPLAHFRRYADIAHGHLMHLAQEARFDGEVVIAVPSSFSREQLAVLSGVLQQSPFKPQAIMDSALIAANHLPDNKHLVYVDLQLHQLSFTRLVNQAGNVRRDAFAVVPGVGATAFANIVVQLVTDAFIAQARFNPQHSAVWEQHLYNELPTWMQQFQSGQQEILVQIKTDKNTAQARVGVSDVLQALQPALQKISRHFLQFSAQFVAQAPLPVVLSERAAFIPGLAFSLKATPLQLPGEQLAEIALQAVPASAAAGNGVPYIRSVARRVSSSPPTIPENTEKSLQPTHLLYQSQAWPLPVSASVNAENTLVLKSGAARQENELFRIEEQGGGVILKSASADVLLLGNVSSADQETNGEKTHTSATKRQKIKAGDVVKITNLMAELQCIKVHT